MDSQAWFILLGILVTAIGYLLKHKDDQQGREISAIKEHCAAEIKAIEERHRQEMTKVNDELRDLFKMHHADVAKLHELELSIADNHYKRGELDAWRAEFGTAVKEIGRSISEQLDKLNSNFSQHLMDHVKKAG